MTVKSKDVSNYHVYFDNYFTSPDLLVFLKKQDLQATGTVRDNRVFTEDMFPNKNSETRKKSKKPAVIQNDGSLLKNIN